MKFVTCLKKISSCICLTIVLSIIFYRNIFPASQGTGIIGDYDIVESSIFTSQSRAPKKDWTFMVYMAADNDLHNFALWNIRQMRAIGSNNHINILVHLDIRNGNQKVTRRYLIEQNKIIHVNAHDPASQKMDSGSEDTLISFCQWTINNYPANKYALVLWNHGTGIIDPARGCIINPSELFTFNPLLNKLEINRTIGFLDFISRVEQEQRGICWDMSSGNYLTNQKLERALKTICTQCLNGNKFDIIGFDACLMSMLEVAHIVKNYAHIMVGSQEVELGTGWDYSQVLNSFTHGTLDTKSFAKNIVAAFANTYNRITNDYTQSAIDLDHINLLEENVHQVAHLLITGIKNQKNNSIRNAIKASRNKLICTHFDEPSYIDLHHFYINLQSNLKHFSLNSDQETNNLREKLNQYLEEGKRFIQQLIIANVAGSNLKNARGISVYFPERKIYHSYLQTTFAASNAWTQFLDLYLLT